MHIKHLSTSSVQTHNSNACVYYFRLKASRE